MIAAPNGKDASKYVQFSFAISADKQVLITALDFKVLTVGSKNYANQSYEAILSDDEGHSYTGTCGGFTNNVMTQINFPTLGIVSGNVTLKIYGWNTTAADTYRMQQTNTISGVVQDRDPYSLTISSAGWASLFLPFPAKVPTGVTAYYASAATNTSVTLSPINANSVIPASFGVVVNGAEGTHSFVYDDGTPAVDKAEVTNKFNGVVVSTSVASIDAGSGNSLYVLGNGDSGVGFYLPSGTLTTLDAYKAYLIAPEQPSGDDAPGIRFIIQDENNATSIQDIQTSDNAVKFIENGRILILRDGITYDLLGRVVR